MAPTRLLSAAVTTLAAALLAAGCGSSSHKAATNSSQSAASGSTTTASGSTAGALSAEATSAATGDIPDNQVFLVLTNHGGAYAIKYPEGWTQNGSGRSLTISDKNNQVRVVISAGSSPTIASVAGQLQALKRSSPSLSFTAPHVIQLPSGAAVAARYTTTSAPNPVTGKRVTLVVDRYELGHRGRVATVDLGTPVGVDNVDAYKKMIRSFRWL